MKFLTGDPNVNFSWQGDEQETDPHELHPVEVEDFAKQWLPVKPDHDDETFSGPLNRFELFPRVLDYHYGDDETDFYGY